MSDKPDISTPEQIVDEAVAEALLMDAFFRQVSQDPDQIPTEFALDTHFLAQMHKQGISSINPERLKLIEIRNDGKIRRTL